MDVDHEIRLRDVEQKFFTHEAVCAERYDGIQRDLSSLSADVADFKNLIKTVGGVLITGMGAILIKIVFFP